MDRATAHARADVVHCPADFTPEGEMVTDPGVLVVATLPKIRERRSSISTVCAWAAAQPGSKCPAAGPNRINATAIAAVAQNRRNPRCGLNIATISLSQ